MNWKRRIICMIVVLQIIIGSIPCIFADALSSGADNLALKYDELSALLAEKNVDILSQDIAALKDAVNSADTGEEYVRILTDTYELGSELLNGQITGAFTLDDLQLFELLYSIHLIGEDVQKIAETYSSAGAIEADADIDSLARLCSGISEFANTTDDERVIYSKSLADIAADKIKIAENTFEAFTGETDGISYDVSSSGMLTLSGPAQAGSYVSVRMKFNDAMVYADTVCADSHGTFSLSFPLKNHAGIYDISVGKTTGETSAVSIEADMSEMIKHTRTIQAKYLSDYSKDMMIATGFDDLVAVLRHTASQTDMSTEFIIKNGNKSQDIRVFLAKYKDNALIECDSESVTLSAGETKNVKLTVKFDADAVYKTFVWKSNLTPYKAVFEEKDAVSAPEPIEKSEQFSGKWRNLVEPCVIDSEEVVFEITAELINSTPITYKAYASVDYAEEYLLGTMTVTPGITRKQSYDFTGIENGEHNIVITVKDGENTVYTSAKDLVVMNGYEKQFMDEFSEFGINWSGSKNVSDDLYMDLFDFAGFTAVRKDTYWSYVEKTKGTFDWSFIANWADEMLAKDVSWNAILDYGNGSVYPMWQSYVGKTLPVNADVRMAPHTQEGIRGYANYGIEVLNRFPKISNLEIWNEPNIGFWQSDYTTVTEAREDMNYEYPDLLKATTATIRSNFKNKSIGGMAFAYQSSYDELGDYLDFGLYPYMSDLTYHFYTTHLDIDDDNAYENRLDAMEAQVIARGGWKPMYVTESGWHTGTASTTREETDIAENLPKLYTICDQKGHKFFAFALNDRGTDPADKEQNWGMLRYDATPKKHYVSVAERNRQLNGAIYVGELNLKNDRIRAFVYLKQGKPVVMAWWDEWFLEDSHTLTLNGEQFSVTDLNGNLVSSNTSTVTLTKNPVYLNGLSHKYIAMAAKEDVVYDRSLFEDTYQSMLPADILAQAETAFANAESALDNATESNIRASIEEFNQLGLDIIAKFENGAITDLVASRATYELSKTVETLGVVYMSEYDGEALDKPVYSTAEVQAKADSLYRDDNRIMQYSDSILSYAVNTEEKAAKLCSLDYSPEDTKGYIAGWGLLTKVYCDWFDSFSDSEKILNYGLLSQVLPESRAAYENADIKIKINANNYSKLPFSGTLRLYDEDGNQIASSESFVLYSNGYKYIELPFTVQRYNNASKRELTISFVDANGNRMADERLSLAIKTQ
ncbi:MAG: hypothetical protein J6D26_05690 [Clostridia bacterium]|nr:hypothetical protein [Clostridia bacterium]